jgi:ribosomal protein S24E
VQEPSEILILRVENGFGVRTEGNFAFVYNTNRHVHELEIQHDALEIIQRRGCELHVMHEELAAPACAEEATQPLEAK